MNAREIDTWSNLVPPAAVVSVAEFGAAVRRHWTHQLRDAQEALDLLPFCPDGVVLPKALVCAAAVATMELAVICSIWPEPLDDVLRPVRLLR